MAKRVRGNRSSHRPGGQGPNRSKRTSDEVEPEELASVIDEEMVDDVAYTEVEVDEVAAAAVAAVTSTSETPAPVPAGRSRRRDRRRSPRQRGSDLSARAAAEDVWVRDDLRRIGVVSLILLAGLLISWVLFGVIDVLGIY